MKNASARNLWGDYLDNHLEYAFSNEPKVTQIGENEKEVKESLNLILSGKGTASQNWRLYCPNRLERRCQMYIKNSSCSS